VPPARLYGADDENRRRIARDKGMVKNYNKKLGQWGENVAAKFFQQKGCKILQRNFQQRFGEIDLICHKNQEIIFVEVKTRTTSFLPGEYSVDAVKKQKIKRMIAFYIQKNELGRDIDFRFDILVVDKINNTVKIRHLENVIL